MNEVVLRTYQLSGKSSCAINEPRRNSAEHRGARTTTHGIIDCGEKMENNDPLRRIPNYQHLH